MDILYLIPARAGSKGLPGKNVKLLNQKPLIVYSIEFSLKHLSGNDELCISTNDDEVIRIAEQMGVKLPFIRPDNLASDTSSTQDVLLHALEYYKDIGKAFDAIMILQPTSPFRNEADYLSVINTYDQQCDMVVTVKEAKENPYFTLFEENELGFLEKSKNGDFQRRQDCPVVYTYNGSIYLINVESLERSRINDFKKIKKVLMPEERSIDIDTMADWTLAEYFSKINN